MKQEVAQKPLNRRFLGNFCGVCLVLNQAAKNTVAYNNDWCAYVVLPYYSRKFAKILGIFYEINMKHQDES
jgi:hypothetical protein